MQVKESTIVIATDLAIGLATLLLIAVGFVGMAWAALWGAEALMGMVFDLLGELK